MVSEFFVGLAAVIFEPILDLFDTLMGPAPDFLLTASDQIGLFLASMNGLGVWAPWGLLFTIVLTTFSLWLVGLAVKGIRAIVAHIPLVGGAG